MARCGIRIEKIKNGRISKVNAIEQHNGRGRMGAEDNVDREMTIYNKTYSTSNYEGAEKTFEKNKKAYTETHTKALRKDTVMGLDVVGYASSGSFDMKDEASRRNWEICCMRFMNRKFGGQEFQMWFHYDEKAPHFHAYVAMGKDGRFNANEWTGNGEILSKTQDMFAEEVQRNFSHIQRGVKGSKDKHKRIQRYYAELGESIEAQGKAQIEEIRKATDKKIAQAEAEAVKQYDDVIKQLGMKVADNEEHPFISDIPLDF